ncbi:MAG: hypothetical protein HQM16_12095 [Deltaproteobacteria bacterium]|nr:hypothetical protein [Deltaproteobacteria bacterium]
MQDNIYDHYVAIDWSIKNMAIARMTKKSNRISVIDVPSDLGNCVAYLKNLKGTVVLTFEETTVAQWMYTELKDGFVDAFARLIGDSDRHFYNVGLFPQFKAEKSLTPVGYRLAPVFDKLPMMFAPVDDRVVERAFDTPLPSIELIDVWSRALNLARHYWDQAANHKSISTGFRKIAAECLKRLKGAPF